VKWGKGTGRLGNWEAGGWGKVTGFRLQVAG